MFVLVVTMKRFATALGFKNRHADFKRCATCAESDFLRNVVVIHRNQLFGGDWLVVNHFKITHFVHLVESCSLLGRIVDFVKIVFAHSMRVFALHLDDRKGFLEGDSLYQRARG